MEHVLVIAGVIWLAVISPGADFAMISRLSAVQGRRSGLFAAAGIATGCWFHVACAIFGLALIERLFPQALTVIRIVGAAYLVYLGITMAFARSRPIADEAAVALSDGRAFVTGLLTDALNPKTSMFVISLYTQTMGGATPIFVQLAYGAFISLSHLLWFGAVAIVLSRQDIRARVLANQRVVNGVIGGILIVLGIALAFSGPIEAGQLAKGRRPIVADAGSEPGRAQVLVPKRIGDSRTSIHPAERAERAQIATQDAGGYHGA